MLAILQISTADVLGGAERVALDLHRAYLARGYPSWLAVGRQRGAFPGVLHIDHDAYRSRWARMWARAGDALAPLVGKVPGMVRVQRMMALGIGQPRRYHGYCQGREDQDFPATWHLLDLPPARPQILHGHNLHGDYLDLRALPTLSQQVPTLLTLHDAWLLSGHCAHGCGCERWRSGCGECPDLALYPPVHRDATRENWALKDALYRDCHLYLATPCHWLMQKVKDSMLYPAIQAARVIPNGIDLSVFRSASQQAARSALGLPGHARILLFAANGIRKNTYKDYQTLRATMGLLAEYLPAGRLLFLALGEAARSQWIGRVEVRFVPFQEDPQVVAQYYQAADIYLHASRADTFPTSVLEALACGAPVVATAVGGIPEQIADGETGYLVPAGDSLAMAARVKQLLENGDLRQRMAARAAETAVGRFGLQRMVEDYLAFYEEIVADCPPRNQRVTLIP